MEGNNIECLKIYKVKVPLYFNDSIGQPGVKYFFPEVPFLNGKNIVGIDVNLNNDNILLDPAPLQNGDLKTPTNLLNPLFDNILRIGQAKNVYCTIYDEDLKEKFFNVPLRSFFMLPSSNFAGAKNPRRVKPYYGKINVKKSYLFLPVGFNDLSGLRYFVYLNFYYN